MRSVLCRSTLFLVIGASLGGATLVSPARACLNAVVLGKNAAIARIDTAEKLLAKGQNKKVVQLLEDIETEDEKLNWRIYRIFAVAQIRSGFVTLGVQSLKAQLERKPDDPYLKTRVAEGQSRMRKPDERKEARATLEALEKADLIPDPEGYLVLATLAEEAQDLATRDRALERCKKMAGDQAQTRCAMKTKPAS